MRPLGFVLLATYVLVQVLLAYELWPDTTSSGWLSTAVILGVLALYVAIGWIVGSWRGLGLALVPLAVALPRMIIQPGDLDAVGLGVAAEVVVLTAIPIAIGIGAAKIARHDRTAAHTSSA